MSSFITCTPRQILSDDKGMEGETGGSCSTHGRDEKCTHNLGRKTWMEEHSGDLCV